MRVLGIETSSRRGTVALVDGADTVVVYAGQALGKPRDAKHAAEVLRLLSGEPHHVMTGWALAGTGRIINSGVEVTALSFRVLTDDEIEAYVATAEPLDRAGSAPSPTKSLDRLSRPGSAGVSPSSCGAPDAAPTLRAGGFSDPETSGAPPESS